MATIITGTATRSIVTAMADGRHEVATLRGLPAEQVMQLMAWLSPAFPVGAFSYSHGIEQAVEAGLVIDRATTASWIAGILQYGAGWVDAGLFLAAHRAVISVDAADLGEIVAMGAAWRGTAETALESSAQGNAFVATLRAGWDLPQAAAWFERLPAMPVYPIAVAIAAASCAIVEEIALAAYLQAFAANLISAAQRLVPLGQTDGQRILATLTAEIGDIVALARKTSFDDIGSAALMVDWTSAQHETQYTRLFRS
ncbi:MAG TPA: urease accessory UreF family protein [Terriglobales bacterium]|nr:urease accessory UreF family protein [Terriglobales bacterium]